MILWVQADLFPQEMNFPHLPMAVILAKMKKVNHATVLMVS